jgi:DNA-binding MarR family transcriptional regulator
MNDNPDFTLLSLLHDLARLIRVEADKRARVHGMTRAGWSLMARLGRYPGMSQKELADSLEVEPISVARMVDRLEAAGMLERRADASDRRIWRLHTLPAAEPILKKMSIMTAELEAAVTQNLSPAARAAMIEGLIQMKTTLMQKAETPSQEGAELHGTTPEAATLPDPLKEIA